jgi:excinuclease UvrABC nuclease subunit
MYMPKLLKISTSQKSKIVRHFRKDTKHHYFGPYTSTDSIFKTLKGLQKLFPLPQLSWRNQRDHPRTNGYSQSQPPGTRAWIIISNAVRHPALAR